MKNTIYPLVLSLVATAVCAEAGDFRPLTQRCEEALALSALPESLRSRANVYVWRNGDFEKTITSDGGFHCVVQRNHPDAIIPECVTSTGADSILQGIMVATRLTADGMSADAVAERTAEMIANGEIASPDEPGVNYMMSAYNRIYTSQADAVRHFPPHTMFFAPGADNETIGGSYQAAMQTPGLPFVAEAGTHSYIVTFTAQSSDSTAVEQACAGDIDLNDAASR
jgi:hypothetical protein